MQVSGFDLPAQCARGRHRFKRGADNLRGSRTIRVVCRFGFQEFGVGEDDAQLIVQMVKQSAKIVQPGSCSIFGHCCGRGR